MHEPVLQPDRRGDFLRAAGLLSRVAARRNRGTNGEPAQHLVLRRLLDEVEIERPVASRRDLADEIGNDDRVFSGFGLGVVKADELHGCPGRRLSGTEMDLAVDEAARVVRLDEHCRHR